MIGNGTSNTTLDTEYDWNVSYVMSIENESVVLRGLHLTRNYWAGLKVYASRVLVEDIKVTAIDDGGIEANGECYLTIHECIVTDTNIGISLQHTIEATVMNCQISGNARSGIRLLAGHDNTIRGNNISDNGAFGIDVTGQNGSALYGNVLRGNSVGVLFENSPKCVLEKCDVSFNDFGVNVTGSDDTILENCTILQNSEIDVFVHDSTGAVALNSSFESVAMGSDADLTARFFLHVLVLDESDNSTVEGADLRVRDSNSTVYASVGFGGVDPETDANGSISWISVVGTVYSSGPNGTTNASAHVNRVKAMYGGWEEERSIHFEESRTETFYYREPYNGTTLYVDDDNAGDTTMDGSPEHPFDTIQRGIDNSSHGYTVRVYDGTYNENITLNVTGLALIGNGSATVVFGEGSGDVVFIDVSDVLFHRFSVTNSGTGAEDSGIHVKGGGVRSNITASNITVSSSSRGIWLDGPGAVNVTDCTLHGNSIGIYASDAGARMWANVSGCEVLDNSASGIAAFGVSDLTISGGTVSRNGDDGIRLNGCDGAVMTGATISDHGDDGIEVTDSDGVLVEGCTLDNNTYGVFSSGSGSLHLWSTAIGGSDSVGATFALLSDGFDVRSCLFDGDGVAIDIDESIDGVIMYTTISSSTTADIRLSGAGGSNALALDTMFDGDSVVCSLTSELTVRNLLRVRVRDQYGDDVQDADVQVEDNDDVVYASEGYSGPDARTDRNGFTPWLWVTDRIYDGSDTATENVTTASAKKANNETVVDVDMSVSHVEVIIVNITEEGILYVDDDNAGDPQMDGSRKHPFDTIAKAIEVAVDGDTIRIWNGTYTEKVNASVANTVLLGNGTGTIVDAGGVGIAILLSSNNVTVHQMSVTDAGTGIAINDVDVAEVADVVFSDVTIAISVRSSTVVTVEDVEVDGGEKGIHVMDSSDITIDGAIARGAINGVLVEDTSSFEFRDLQVTGSWAGIVLDSSTDGLLRSCSMSDNTYNFGVVGSTKAHHAHDIDISNRVNGRSIYYFVDRVEPVSLKGSLGFVGLVNTGGTVDVSVENNLAGILIAFSDDVNVSGDVSDSRTGLVVIGSDDVLADGLKASNVENGTQISSSTVVTISGSDFSSSGAGIDLRFCDVVSVVNTTIDSDTPFNLLSSKARTLGVVFDDPIVVSATSRLVVENHLHIHVNATGGGDLQGADARVDDNGNTIYASSGYGGSDPQTDDEGFIRWIVVTDRIYDGSPSADENVTDIEVKYGGWMESRSDIDMSRSHTEWFDENPPANEAPYCSIIDPRDSDKVGGQIDVFGNASDDDGTVIDVWVRIDSGGWELADGTENWIYQWDTVTTTDGEHWIHAKSRDDKFAESAVHSIKVIVDNSNYAPNVTITDPEDGSVVSGTVTVEGVADDPEGEMESVEVAILPAGTIPSENNWTTASDTSGDGSWSTWEFEWDTMEPNRTADGNYTVHARARDQADHTKQTSISVYVDNPDRPTVTVRTPRTGDELAGPIVINGTADDPDLDGGVEAVYVAVVEKGTDPKGGDWKEAEDTSGNSSSAYSTWEYEWDTRDAEDGNYTIHVRAYDGEELSEDRQVNVSVDNVNELPSTAITEPGDGDDVSYIIDVQGYSIDGDDNLDKVEVSIDDDSFATNKLSTTLQKVAWNRWNWTAKWDTRNYEPGNHTLFARTTDKRGGRSEVHNVTVRVWENVPPRLKFTNPGDEDEDYLWKGEQDHYFIQWEDNDPDDNASMKFSFTAEKGDEGTRIPGIYFEDTTDSQGREIDTLRWEVDKVAEGDYYLCAVLEDEADNKVTVYSKGRVLIREGTPNSAPSIEITQPDGEDDVIELNGTYQVWFNATDEDGDVLDVYLYYDEDTDQGNGYTAMTNGSLDGTVGHFIWETAGVPRGEYYVLGAVYDGVNDVVWDYSTGTISIGDLVKPSGVHELVAQDPGFGGTVNLTWTAPGDDGDEGWATGYEVRFSSTGSITTSNWAGATIFPNDMVPAAPGENESLDLTGIENDVQHWIAVRAVDDEGNMGPIVQVTAAPTRVSRSVQIIDLPTGFGGDVSWLGYGSLTALFDDEGYKPPYGLSDIGIFIAVEATGFHERVLINITYTVAITGVDPDTIRIYRRTVGQWRLVADTDHDVEGRRIWGRVGHLSVFAPMASGLPSPTLSGFTSLPDRPDEDDDITVEITITDPAGRTPTEVFVNAGGKRFDMILVEGEPLTGMVYRAVFSLDKGTYEMQVVVRIGEESEFRSSKVSIDVAEGESDEEFPWTWVAGGIAVLALLSFFLFIVRPRMIRNRQKEATRPAEPGIAPPLASIPREVVEADVYEAPGIVVMEGEEAPVPAPADALEVEAAEVPEVATPTERPPGSPEQAISMAFPRAVPLEPRAPERLALPTLSDAAVPVEPPSPRAIEARLTDVGRIMLAPCPTCGHQLVIPKERPVDIRCPECDDEFTVK
ncbi:MAG: right-handed parallel beta-helix repeat-containing protein [Thermoplasmata archaeon]|nr:right-handed parallel beta-helix repeat-containing protein [Thermoplasmata archaeon]